MRNLKLLQTNRVVNQVQLCKRDPFTVEEALKPANAAEWQRAMEDEIQAHAEHGTWTLSEVPTGRKIIKCKWVF